MAVCRSPSLPVVVDWVTVAAIDCVSRAPSVPSVDDEVVERHDVSDAVGEDVRTASPGISLVDSATIRVTGVAYPNCT